MGTKIPITVVSGFFGSGKTTLLNRLLNAPGADRRAMDRVAVLVDGSGDTGLDHHLVRRLNDSVSMVESACFCCAVRGELVAALRDLFFAALQKKIPALSHVLIETGGLADPAPIMATLRYERFLSERYFYDGCICVVDSVYGRRQLREHPEVVRQVILADTLVLGNDELADPAEHAALESELRDLNAVAPMVSMEMLPALPDLLRAGSLRRSSAGAASGLITESGLWSGRRMRVAGSPHADVKVVDVTWRQPIARSVFVRAMSVLQTLDQVDIVRIKGVVRFQDEAQASVVHGVHQQLCAIEPLAQSGSCDAVRSDDSALVFILRGMDETLFRQKALLLLSGDDS